MTIICPHCHTECEGTPDLVGTEVRCPNCRNTFIVKPEDQENIPTLALPDKELSGVHEDSSTVIDQTSGPHPPVCVKRACNMLLFNIAAGLSISIGSVLFGFVSKGFSNPVANSAIAFICSFITFGIGFYLICQIKKGFSFSRSLLNVLMILGLVFSLPVFTPFWRPSNNGRVIVAIVALLFAVNGIVALVFLNTRTANAWFREMRVFRKRVASRIREGAARDSAIKSHSSALGAVDPSGNAESLKRYLIAACSLLTLLIVSVIWVGTNLSSRESVRGTYAHETQAVVERVQSKESAPKETAAIDIAQGGRKEEQTREQPPAERPKDGDECFRLGCQYLNGDGVVQNDAEAFNWFQKGATQGNASAQYNLGWMYNNGRGVPRNYTNALKWYLKSAENGDAMAQCQVGLMYGNGLGTERNNLEAVNWYRKAADQGYSRAQYYLGNMYLVGNGVLQSDSTAANWYKKAAEQGHAAAQNKYGWMLSSGKGVPRNDFEAFKWFKKAAEQGVVLAQARVGYCYRRGRGVQANDGEAAKWYLKAAEQGNASAQFLLGDMYAEGLGVSRNNEQAIKWVGEARKQGITDRGPGAAAGLGLLLLSEQGFLQYRYEVESFLTDAANQGDAEAQFALGIRYLNDGYEKLASDRIKQAAAQGHREAQEFLKQKREAIAAEKRRRYQQAHPYDPWAF